VGTQSDSAGLWDLESLERVGHFAGHKGAVRAVAVTPKGDLAFTGGDDGTVRAWRLPDGAPAGSFVYDAQGVSALAVAPDGQLVACTGPNGAVRFFDPLTGRPRANMAAQSAGFALAFLGDGQDLVAAREPDPITIHLQNPKSPPPPIKGGGTLALQEEADLGEGVFRIGYRPDGKVLWMRRPGTLAVADGATGKEIKSWPVEGNVNNAAFGDGKELYTTSAGGRFRAWDWETGDLLHDFDATVARSPRPVAFFPTGKNRLLVVTESPDLLVWDTARWKEADRLTPYPGEPVTFGCPCPDGNRVALWVGGPGGSRAVIWDVAGRREALRLDPAPVTGMVRLEASPGGKWVLGFAQDGGGQVLVWDAGTGKLAHTIPGVRPANLSGGFSPGGRLYIANERGNRRIVLDLETGQVTDEGPGFRNVTHIAADAAPAAGLFATADADRKLRVWRVEKDNRAVGVAGKTPGKTPTDTPGSRDRVGLLKESADLPDPVTACAFATDGKKVYVGTAKGEVHVLDAATGEPTGKFAVSAVRLHNLVLVPRGINPVNGAAVPERLFVLDDDRHVYTVETGKGTKRDLNLAKAIPDVSPTSQLVVAPGESHLMVFDLIRAEAFSWDLRKGDRGAPPGLSRPPFAAATRYVAYSADGAVGAAYASRKVLVWRPKTGKDVRVLDTTLTAEWLGLSADAGVVVVADRTRFQAWDFNTGASLPNVREPHGQFVPFVAAMILTGPGLVTVGGDQRLRVWDLKAGSELGQWRLPRFAQPAKGVAVSPDGKTAVVWHTDETKVSLWNLPDLKAKKP
jgi:WD40 repeat protein